MYQNYFDIFIKFRSPPICFHYKSYSDIYMFVVPWHVTIPIANILLETYHHVIRLNVSDNSNNFSITPIKLDRPVQHITTFEYL